MDVSITSDPSFQILLGISSNVLTGLAKYSLVKTGQFFIDKEFLNKIARNEKSLSKKIEEAIDSLSQKIEIKGFKTEELCLFLYSQDVENLIRQIFSTKIGEKNPEGKIKSIEKEFVLLVKIRFGTKSDEVDKKSESLFKLILDTCLILFDKAIEENLITALDAKSAFRTNIILDEIKSVQHHLKYLTSIRNEVDVSSILDFGEKYQKQVLNRHGYIIPANFDGAKKIPIDKLYVCPDFIFTDKKDDNDNIIQYTDFAPNIYRTVVLGNPGGGKSTFSKKLACDLVKHSENKLINPRSLTPILVILRDYGISKKEKATSIVDFINLHSKVDYQINPPNEAFEYLLSNNRIILIFDGLDELLDTNYRQEISDDIESFCNLYPSIPVVVTSREVGYEQAPLSDKFKIYKIHPFDENQVHEYVEKWFNLDDAIAKEHRKNMISSFVKESSSIPDIRSNALMLSLMCNIYRGENYIPKNRPDLYEKCAVMLFERWDRSRGLYEAPFEHHLRNTLMFLAFWIYTEEGLQSGVTESKLVQKAVEYLYPSKFADKLEAMSAAQKMITFSKGRAWVFTDTGTTKDGEALFQFTHRTFLEYFTAFHITRIFHTPKDMSNFLYPHIANREWDVVAQLSFQIQNKNIEKAGDYLLNSLIKKSLKDKTKQWEILSFTNRCLEFLIPDPKILKKIVNETMNYLIESTKQNLEKNQSILPIGDRPTDLVDPLINSHKENFALISSYIENYSINAINRKEFINKIYSYEILSNLNNSLYSNPILEINEQRIIEIDDLFNRVRVKCKKTLEVISEKNFLTAFREYIIGSLALKDIIRAHGFESLFYADFYKVYNYISNVPISSMILRYAFDYIPKKGQNHSRIRRISTEELNLINDYILTKSPPFVTVNKIMTNRIHHSISTLTKYEYEAAESLSANIIFGGFLLFAISLDLIKYQNIKNSLLINLKTSSHPIIEKIRYILISKYETKYRGYALGEIEEGDFNPEQINIILDWVDSRESFAKMTKGK